SDRSPAADLLGTEIRSRRGPLRRSVEGQLRGKGSGLTLTRAPCVVSVAEHTGWAHLVCVAAPGPVPAVIARRRVTLIDSGLPTQPYEPDSTEMGEDDANDLMGQGRGSIAARSSDALTRVVTELPRPYVVVAVAIRKPPFANLPKTV